MAEKSMGILLMVTFGVSGVGVTALAWLCPALNLDKTMATLAGIIGVGFAVFQGLRFRHSRPAGAGPLSVEVQAQDKT
jgi:hypothetical protein